MPQSALYCIVLLPNSEVSARISMLKEEMGERFEAKHAIKSPPHITLQMPFRKAQEKEMDLLSTLKTFAGRMSNFRVDLNGFGCFAPRVIFIKVIRTEPIKVLHKELKEILSSKIGLDDKIINANIHPHMTIATRDLTRSYFKQAWMEFEHREFIDSFEVYDLCLLKHDTIHWEVFQRFSFAKA